MSQDAAFLTDFHHAATIGATDNDGDAKSNLHQGYSKTEGNPEAGQPDAFSDLEALVDFGTEATWPILSYIKVNHRFGAPGVPSAVRTLGAIGDTEAVPPLLEVLEEAKDPEVQIAVVETLGRIGGPMAFDQVEKAARSEDWRLRAKAATALATLGDESVIPTLALGLEDQNWWVRRNSAASLSHFPVGIDV